MSESDDTQLTSISKARTLKEIAEFWDTHSTTDYWDQMMTLNLKCLLLIGDA